MILRMWRCLPNASKGDGEIGKAWGLTRVKWTFLSGGREAEVLVARGLRVKVSEIGRAHV